MIQRNIKTDYLIEEQSRNKEIYFFFYDYEGFKKFWIIIKVKGGKMFEIKEDLNIKDLIYEIRGKKVMIWQSFTVVKMA